MEDDLGYSAFHGTVNMPFAFSNNHFVKNVFPFCVLPLTIMVVGEGKGNKVSISQHRSCGDGGGGGECLLF